MSEIIHEYVYLLQEREFIKSDENVFKIGRTTQEISKRLGGYPKGTKICCFNNVKNCFFVEIILKKEFKKKFKQRVDIGIEYFEGNLCEILATFNKIIHDNWFKNPEIFKHKQFIMKLDKIFIETIYNFFNISKENNNNKISKQSLCDNILNNIYKKKLESKFCDCIKLYRSSKEEVFHVCRMFNISLEGDKWNLCNNILNTVTKTKKHNKFYFCMKNMGNLKKQFKIHYLQNNELEKICSRFGIVYNKNETKTSLIKKIENEYPNNTWNMNIINLCRTLLITENKKIFENDKKSLKNLIYSKNKCIKFLKKNGITKEPIVKNWFKYCIGDILFEKLKRQYYYTKKDILKSCEKIGIYNIEDYKKLHIKDKMLPPLDYIMNGFYLDLDTNFNLVLLLEENGICYDF